MRSIAISEQGDRDAAVLSTILKLFHDASAREAEPGISMRKVYGAMNLTGDRTATRDVLQRLERKGLVTWVAVLNGGYRVWPTPIAVRAAASARTGRGARESR